MPIKRNSRKLAKELVDEGAPMSIYDPEDMDAEPGRLWLRYAEECGPYKRARTRAIERARRKSGRGEIDYTEFTDTKMPELVAKYLAVKWEGILDDNGADMEFSEEEVKRWLMEDKKLLAESVEFSNDPANYRHVEARAETVGKLRAVSASS